MDAFASALTTLIEGIDPARANARPPVDPDLAARSFRHYLAHAWPQIDPAPFLPNWHIDAAADHLEAVSAGHITRLIISQPPGTAKSLTASVLWPSWQWGPRGLPSRRMIAISYGGGNQSPALRDGRRCRSLMESPWYQAYWGDSFRFTSDQNTKGYYENSKGGYRVSTGLKGAASGLRCDDMLFDDPLKLTDRLSQPALDQVISAWNDVFRSRLSDHTSRVVLIMQRLNTNDLAGYFESRAAEDGWVILRLPRRFEPGDRCRTFVDLGDGRGRTEFFADPRTQQDEQLHPQRKSEAEDAKDRREMGEWRYAAEEQQHPVPLSGGMIKLAWVERWHDRFSCGNIAACPNCFPDAFDELIQSWDCTFKKGEKNSWVVGHVWGRRNARAYLLAQRRGHWDLPDTMRELLQLTADFPEASAKLIEDKANGPAIIQMLGNVVPGLIAQEVEGSKEARVAAVAPFWQAHNVLIPEDDHPSAAFDPDGVNWVPQFVAEVTQFPNARFDDQTDAMSQGVWRLLGGIQLGFTSIADLNAGVPAGPVAIPAAPPTVLSGGNMPVAPNRFGTGDRGGSVLPSIGVGSLRKLFGR